MLDQQQHIEIVAAVDAICDTQLTGCEEAIQEVAESTGLSRDEVAQAWDTAVE